MSYQGRKKFPKNLEGTGKNTTFAPETETHSDMKEPKYCITGVNCLTGGREEISRPMSEEEARARLDWELQSRKRQKYPAHIKLRVEKRLPIQLMFNFQN